MSNKFLKIFAILLAAIQFNIPLSGSSEVLTPAITIQSTVDNVRKTVVAQEGKISPEALELELRKIIAPVFDFETMAQSCLGPNWQEATPAQQKEFVELFSDLLAKTYLKKIRENAATSKLEIVGEKIKGDKSIVKTTVEYAEDQKAAIEYRMKQEQVGWRVADVIIENIGLVSNYRSEFSGIVKNSKIEGLLVKLREKEKTKH